MIDVYYLGPKYTYTYLAAQKHFDKETNYIPAESIDQVFEKINEDKDSKIVGIVPAENSLEGIVNSTFDNLIKSNAKIQACIEMDIQHYLLSNKDHSLDKIEHVHSHIQALGQCNNWLGLNLKRATCTATNSTAKAVDGMLRTGRPSAIIGSKELALGYNLKILEKIILPNNVTKFFVISKNNEIDLFNKHFTWYAFSLPNESGSLYEALKCFYDNKINLTHIHSRPNKLNNWEYVFYVCAENCSSYVVSELTKTAYNVKILGAYKGDKP